jgi:hypothetical protein
MPESESPVGALFVTHLEILPEMNKDSAAKGKIWAASKGVHWSRDILLLLLVMPEITHFLSRSRTAARNALSRPDTVRERIRVIGGSSVSDNVPGFCYLSKDIIT